MRDTWVTAYKRLVRSNVTYLFCIAFVVACFFFPDRVSLLEGFTGLVIGHWFGRRTTTNGESNSGTS